MSFAGVYVYNPHEDMKNSGDNSTSSHSSIRSNPQDFYFDIDVLPDMQPEYTPDERKEMKKRHRVYEIASRSLKDRTGVVYAAPEEEEQADSKHSRRSHHRRSHHSRRHHSGSHHSRTHHSRRHKPEEQGAMSAHDRDSK